MLKVMITGQDMLIKIATDFMEFLESESKKLNIDEDALQEIIKELIN